MIITLPVTGTFIILYRMLRGLSLEPEDQRLIDELRDAYECKSFLYTHRVKCPYVTSFKAQKGAAIKPSIIFLFYFNIRFTVYWFRTTVAWGKRTIDGGPSKHMEFRCTETCSHDKTCRILPNLGIE